MWRWVRIAAVAGGLWGLACYSVLWGYVPIEVHRPFVISTVGTILLLPARIVLWAIHALENAAGHPFDLAARSGWIGLAIILAGAGVLAAAALGIGLASRFVRSRRSGGESVPEPAQRV